MIHLIPFYQNLTHELHSRRREVDNPIFNLRYSISVLNSVLPAMAEYVVEHNEKCIVIPTPSPNESQIIVSYLVRQITSGAFGDFRNPNIVKFYDLRPSILVKEPGVYVGNYNSVVANVISCDTILSYYPYTFPMLQRLSGLADTVALFDPANKKGNWYAEFIKQALRRENGIVK